jgi:hypothetical protein
MIDHLTKRKKPCPTVKNDIELTPEIKQHILDYRVYHIKKEVHAYKTLNQQINNYNIIVNAVNNMDVKRKVDMLTHYTETPLKSLEESVIEKSGEFVENGGREDAFMDMVEFVLERHNISDYNLFYQKRKDTFSMYDGLDWADIYGPKIVQIVLLILQNNIWDDYELALVRKCDAHPSNHRAFMSLDKLFAFYQAVNLIPFIDGMNDTQIKYNRGTAGFSEPCYSYDTSEKFLKTFRQSIGGSKGEFNKFISRCIQLIKTKRKMSDVNDKIVSLTQSDATFCQLVTGR